MGESGQGQGQGRVGEKGKRGDGPTQYIGNQRSGVPKKEAYLI